MHRFDLAAQSYKNVYDKNPDATVRARLAECYVKSQQFDLAEPLLAQLMKESGRSMVNLLLVEAAVPLPRQPIDSL